MSIYNTDIIEWTSRTEDEDGVVTIGTPTDINCQFEEKNELISINNGQNIQSACLIFIHQNIDIKKGDTVVLKNKFGAATGDTRLYTVIKVKKPNNFSFSHLEIWI